MLFKFKQSYRQTAIYCRIHETKRERERERQTEWWRKNVYGRKLYEGQDITALQRGTGLTSKCKEW